VRNRNAIMQRQRERLVSSGELMKMTADEREEFERALSAAPVPAAVVGATGDPAWSLISFEFVHESAGRLLPRVRPLAATKDTPGVIRLEGSGGAWLTFGVDATSLSGSAEGRVEIRALLRTIGRRGMWLGEASSEPIAIRLSATSAETGSAAAEEGDYLEGRFHLLDRQFERARSIGERISARSPDSVAAFELLGDAFAGMGRLDEAVRAYSAGIESFRKRASVTTTFLSPPDAEHPTYLMERLGDVRARQQKAR
jgi:hypothetical protein